MNKPLAAMSILLFVAGANAAITASLVDMGQQGFGDYCLDIVVTVADDGPNPDDWTACGMTATLTGAATFVDNDTYNPPYPSDGLGDPYDSFFTGPLGYPNGEVLIPPPIWFGTVIEDPQLRFGEWYDTADTGAGTFVLHRLNVVAAAGSMLIIDFETAAANTGGQLFPFHWEIPVPEAASLSLLALGGLALLRRR